MLGLISDAIAFNRVSQMAYEEIDRLGASEGDQRGINGNESGWPKHDVWESLQSASYFNLGTALELLFKGILYLEGGSWKESKHDLYSMYKKVSPSIRGRLDAAWDLIDKSKLDWIAAYAQGPKPKPTTKAARLESLEDWLYYLTHNIRVWNRRFQWENRLLGDGHIQNLAGNRIEDSPDLSEKDRKKIRQDIRFYIDVRVFHGLFEALRVIIEDLGYYKGAFIQKPPQSTSWKRTHDFLVNNPLPTALDSFYKKSGWTKGSDGSWRKKTLNDRTMRVRKPEVFWRVLLTQGEGFRHADERFIWSSSRRKGSDDAFSDPVCVAELLE